MAHRAGAADRDRVPVGVGHDAVPAEPAQDEPDQISDHGATRTIVSRQLRVASPLVVRQPCTVAPALRRRASV